jgi:hypothetical protein
VPVASSQSGLSADAVQSADAAHSGLEGGGVVVGVGDAAGSAPEHADTAPATTRAIDLKNLMSTSEVFT